MSEVPAAEPPPLPKPGVAARLSRRLGHQAVASLLPALLGLGAALLCVRVANQYGLALFIGLPVVVAFLAAFFRTLRVGRAFADAYATAVLAQLALGGLILIVALDGLVCLLMALPLSMLLALPGTALGIVAARAVGRRFASLTPLLACLLFPGLVAFEHQLDLDVPLREVTTRVPIRASASQVWDIVIAFPRITTPPDGIFRCGVACPIAATIEGSGVGAVRRCTFTTGDFVEPVTVWKPGELLAFDVTSSPPPLDEVSIYEHIDAPHLHGHLQSRRGQFRIVPSDGGVTLEGTTWYQHRMWPQWYWGPLSDHIIHRIHGRVLDHIRNVAETTPAGVSPSR
jgi:hypothetical protein